MKIQYIFREQIKRILNFRWFGYIVTKGGACNSGGKGGDSQRLLLCFGASEGSAKEAKER